MNVKRFSFRNCVAKVEKDRLTMRVEVLKTIVEAGRNGVSQEV